MTRLIIQIPCLNEAESLPATLAELPRQIPGVDEVVVLVIDDGSVDDTAEVALRSGADHVVRHKTRQGVARAFVTGLRAALDLGADLVVNTDADNQYPGRYIPALVEPLLRGEADMVVGDRNPGELTHFSPLKRRLQRLGSWTVSRFARCVIPDAASGFRAFTREAATRLQVYTGFSYTLETLIQAGRQGMAVTSVPLEANDTPRPSRLHRNNLHYVVSQALSIARAFAYYEPLKTFGLLGLPFVGAGLFLELRFLWFFLSGQGGVARYIQSVTIGGFLITVGFMLWALGLIGDGLLANRRLSEDVLVRLQQLEERLPPAPDRAASPAPPPADPRRR